MHISKRLLFFPIIATLPFVFGLMNCARESRPMGGPKDTLSPVVVKERPIQPALSVSPKKVTIKFNERIELENIDNNCLITPSFEEQPDITAKKKKLIIDLHKQKLEENVTYTFNFLNAIKDVNEGNLVEQYSYAFSTGAILDTLKISGKVVVPDSKSEKDRLLVVLYDNLSDSAFTSLEPKYITQASTKGTFQFNNIKQGSYKLYALVDKNDDFMYSDGAELIGFYNSIVTPKAEIILDTLWYTTIIHDTLGLQKDSVVKDSFDLKPKVKFSPENIVLEMFTNKQNDLFIRSKERISPLAYALGFSKPISKELITCTFPDYTSNDFSLEFLDSKDSVIVWFQNHNLITTDSAAFFVSYKSNEIEKTDTMIVSATKLLADRILFDDKNFPKEIFEGDSILIKTTRPIAKINSDFQLFELFDTTALKSSTGEFYTVDAEGNPTNYLLTYPTLQHFSSKNFYLKQTLIDKKIGQQRFALYFSHPIDSATTTVKPQVAIQGKVFKSEVDFETNSLLFWLTNEELMHYKNPQVLLSFVSQDSLVEELVSFSDFIDSKEKMRSIKTPKMEAVVSKEQQDALFLNNTIELIWNSPIAFVNDTLFALYEVGDSTETNFLQKIERNPNSNRRLEIYHSVKPDKTYILQIDKAAVLDVYSTPNKEQEIIIKTQKKSSVKKYMLVPSSTELISERELYVNTKIQSSKNYALVSSWNSVQDFYGDVTDSLHIQFNVPKSESFGNLQLQIDSVTVPVVIELQPKDSKSKADIIQQSVTSSSTIEFKNLKPGDYIITCVYDLNGNGSWDTGDIYSKTQPEKRVAYKKAITIKANWDNTLQWAIPNN